MGVIRTMRKVFFILLFGVILLTGTWVKGQSLAYMALLRTYYDVDFPLIYPGDSMLLGNAILLDTRERDEYEVSRIHNARWVGYDTFTIGALDNVPKDTPLVVYCSIGARSQEVGKRLKEAGFSQVYNLYGGIFHWVNEGFPIFNQKGPTLRVHAYSRSWGIWVNKGQKVYSSSNISN